MEYKSIKVRNERKNETKERTKSKKCRDLNQSRCTTEDNASCIRLGRQRFKAQAKTMGICSLPSKELIIQ